MGNPTIKEFTPPSVQELNAFFPGYTVSKFIAKGGMGAVYLGEQLSLERPVAIKILPKEFGDDTSYRTSFETEAKAMGRLNHPNLVSIHDFGDVNGMLYIIMEFVPGRSLFETAHGHPVDEKHASLLIRDICLGLEHAHEHGMIHRDIKPANVLIDDEAHPKIVDFGLARPVSQKQTEGMIFGTPGYIAPEVLTSPMTVDHRSDIFSTGVMLYELLVGKMPEVPYKPPSLISDTDARFDTIIRKSIDPKPDNRYTSAREMANDLQYLVDHFDELTFSAHSPKFITQPSNSLTTSNLNSTHLNSSPSSQLKTSEQGSPALLLIAAIVTIGFGGFLAFSPDKPRSEFQQVSEAEFPAGIYQNFSESSKHNTSKEEALYREQHSLVSSEEEVIHYDDQYKGSSLSSQ